MELYSKLHMRANVVDPNCSSSLIAIGDLVVPSGKAAIFRIDVPTLPQPLLSPKSSLSLGVARLYSTFLR